MYFSSNVRGAKQNELSNILGVNNDLKSGKYLVLPSLVGRSKKRVFDFVKEKVWKRLHGWRAKTISRAGKAVMIRNVAQSIPSYCMSCFLLSKYLCQEIERMMNKYWWSLSTSERREVIWLVWDTMSMFKSRSGMDFRKSL